MKASKNIIASTLKTVLILLLIVFQSCGTYNSKTAEIESDLFSGDFKQAIARIDQNKFLLKDRNRLLYLMEKGKLEHLVGNYENSNALLEQAYILIDDRIRTNAGQAVAAKFTNPMAEPYKGEDFEKVTIHYYKALNYFHLGMPNEALVEAKRINIKLYELNEKYVENKNKYSEDAFSQILQGILYEGTGDINNAFIAYRNAEEIYKKDGGKFFGVPMPEQLEEDLLRTTKLLGFREEHEAYRKKFNVAPDPAVKQPAKKGKKGKKTQAPAAPAVQLPKVTGEAVVFWENGLGPAKDQLVITASGAYGAFVGTYNDGDVAEQIIIPIPPGVDIGVINAIAIPKYRKRESYYSKAAIIVNGEEEPFELAQDFYPIAKQCLKDRMLREVIDLVLRFATKKAASAGFGALGKELLGDVGGELVKMGADVAGAATEKADTRNWQSLPATISYVRVPLSEGENKFIIKKYGVQGIDTDTLYIPYKRGLQIVNYFDLGRTQLVPTTNAASIATGQSSASLLAVPGTNSLQAVSKTATGSFKAVPAGVTSKTVIDNYIKAIGGDEKIKGIETLYIANTNKTVVSGKPMSDEMVRKINKNNDSSIESYQNGKLTMKMVANNSGGYMIFGDSSKKTKMDDKTYRSIKNNKSLLDSYYEAVYSKNSRLDGITKFNNEDVYAISYTPESSNMGTMTDYYSIATGLLVARGYNVPEQQLNSTTVFSDYREVKGIKFSFYAKTSINNGAVTEMITKEMKVNEGVTDGDFK